MAFPSIRMTDGVTAGCMERSSTSLKNLAEAFLRTCGKGGREVRT
jgi:hypothetical protein